MSREEPQLPQYVFSLALHTDGWMAPFPERYITGSPHLAWNGVMGLPTQGLIRQPGAYCGFAAFVEPEPHEQGEVRDQRDLAPRARDWPFADAVVLAKPRTGGRFDPVVSCSNGVKRDGYPYCSTKTDFRGWPADLYLSGKHVCDVEHMVTRVRRILDRFVQDETPRTLGEIEHRRNPFGR